MADEEQMQQEEPTEQYKEENGGTELASEEPTETQNQTAAADEDDDEDDRLELDTFSSCAVYSYRPLFYHGHYFRIIINLDLDLDTKYLIIQDNSDLDCEFTLPYS